MNTLDDLANKYITDKGSKYPGTTRHGYATIYEKYLSKWRNSEINMLEIGVCMESSKGGHSVRMWYEYFDKAKIYTFDIIDMSKLENDRVKFFRGDQSKRIDFKNMHSSFGYPEFEFILEDGSHRHEHQMISLGALFKYLKSGGIYILEDITLPGKTCFSVRNEKTLETINKYLETGNFESPFITSEEKEYLEKNIKSIEIHKDIQDLYATAIFTKK
jgi:hypothetical protein